MHWAKTRCSACSFAIPAPSAPSGASPSPSSPGTPAGAAAGAGSSPAGGIGAAKDTVVSLAREAVYVGGVVDPAGRGRQCPDGDIGRIGADTTIPRLPGELAASYRARLAVAFDAWSDACTASGVLDAVELLGYGRPALITQRVLPVDGYASLWARFVLIFPDGAAIEGADLVIRLLDTAYSAQWPLGEAMLAKMAFNETRPYKHGGKEF